MGNSTTTKDSKAVSGPSLTSLIPFDQISQPGAYVCAWSGHLLRVPSDGISSSGGPMINFVGPEPLFVVKIADNPFVTMTKARLLACNFDVDVSF